jgi:NAD(P)-dependent dehydrogenase (short-subunit alcohol dehydrogenase family)
MKGKVVLVTGASSGIGLETARGLAAQGATVVLLVRSRARGEAAITEIRRTVPDASLHLVLADLYAMAEVRRAAADFRSRWDRLDVLVHNAGLIHSTRELTVDGFERTFALNHLAPFLLTYELRELLQRSAPARVVTVASLAHKWGALDFDDLQAERGFKEMTAYGNSKLCNILFSNELARKMAGTGVTSNSLHPGTVRTNFGQSGGFLLRWGVKIAAPFFLSAAGGARTSIYLASSPEVEGVTGKYFERCKEATPRRAALSPEVAKRLWDVSAKLVGVSW